MNKWKVTTLGNHIKIKHGFAFKGDFITDKPNDNILVTPGNFKIGGGFKQDKLRYYSDDNFPSEYILEVKDLIITMTDLSVGTDTLGYSALIPRLKSNYLHNQRIGLVELLSDSIDKKWLYWKLRSRHYQRSIAITATGTTVKHTSPKRIYEYEFYLPPLPEQKSIAAILSSLDSKIENLRRQNQTLEMIAQTLFQHWFVDFEFPNENGKPYKSSGGKMIDSELGLIPEGWRKVTLGSIASIERGLSYKGKYLSDEGVPMINLGNFDIKGDFRSNKIKYYSGDFKDRHTISTGDILIANTDMTHDRVILGRPLIVPEFTSSSIIFSHHIYALKDIRISKSYVFYYLKSNLFRERAESYATGTTVLALPKDAISEINILIPPNNILDNYSSLVIPMLELKKLIYIQIQTLTKTRDTLLPKLMSGEIRVPKG